ALDPNNADSYENQAVALNFAGRPAEALRTVEQAMRLNPRYPAWYLFDVGLAYINMGRYAEAIAALQTLVLRNANFLAAYVLLASSYWQQWAYQLSLDPQTLEQGLEAGQRAIVLNDSLHFGHIGLGYVYLYQHQYEQALAEMER